VTAFLTGEDDRLRELLSINIEANAALVLIYILLHRVSLVQLNLALSLPPLDNHRPFILRLRVLLLGAGVAFYLERGIVRNPRVKGYDVLSLVDCALSAILLSLFLSLIVVAHNFWSLLLLLKTHFGGGDRPNDYFFTF
jgi:hypothetical protein